jgi:hypothetical protein
MEHAIVPFGAASNACLSLLQCIGMLWGAGAETHVKRMPDMAVSQADSEGSTVWGQAVWTCVF